jgi:N-acetylglucosaminyldiphosphoundecaprenol N-acetyl-beta-D-mannosaminyltransferase
MIAHYPLGHLKISAGDLSLFLSYLKNSIRKKEKSYCIPLHITKYELSKADQKLRDVINSADMVIADGAPIPWFCRRLGYKSVHHVTGIEFAEAILKHSRENDWRIFFLGAHPRNLEKALTNIKSQFNDPLVAGFHDGYFSADECSKIIEKINAVKPDILFLGLGMPQKEYFVYDYFNKAEALFWLPVGGSFDIWARVKKRSPVILHRMGLEWIQRSFYNRDKAKNVFTYGFSFFKDFLFYKQ